jgi:hypothetical protein
MDRLYRGMSAFKFNDNASHLSTNQVLALKLLKTRGLSI